MVAGAVATIALGSVIMRRRLPPEPLPLADPFEVPVQLENAWGIYPAAGDFDGDGRVDLLVGGPKGRMQVHRNVGTVDHPKFVPPVWLDELCPNGRIPTG
jgi:hypothetical protein